MEGEQKVTDQYAALKAAKAQDSALPDGYWGADSPKCPHCGHVCKISDNEWWRLYEEGEHEVECPDCGGAFTVQTRVSYSFSTEHQEGA